MWTILCYRSITCFKNIFFAYFLRGVLYSYLGFSYGISGVFKEISVGALLGTDILDLQIPFVLS